MPDGISVDIQGLSELQAKLEQLATSRAERCIRTALKAGAEIEQAAVEDKIPRRLPGAAGTALPEGALKGDISFEIKRSQQGNLAAIVGPGKLTAHVAEWVEEGHRLVKGGYSKETKPGSGKYRGPGKEVSQRLIHIFARHSRLPAKKSLRPLLQPSDRK
jgi:HK97 gp10 family phage protein